MKLGGRWQMFKHLIFSLGLTNKCQSLFNHENSLEKWLIHGSWFAQENTKKNFHNSSEKKWTLWDRTVRGMEYNWTRFISVLAKSLKLFDRPQLENVDAMNVDAKTSTDDAETS